MQISNWSHSDVIPADVVNFYQHEQVFKNRKDEVCMPESHKTLYGISHMYQAYAQFYQVGNGGLISEAAQVVCIKWMCCSKPCLPVPRITITKSTDEPKLRIDTTVSCVSELIGDSTSTSRTLMWGGTAAGCDGRGIPLRTCPICVPQPRASGNVSTFNRQRG